MGIYLNGLFIQCDAKYEEGCEEQITIQPEAGNGEWFEEGTVPNLKGFRNWLNQEFDLDDSGSNYNRDHVYGWKAIIERRAVVDESLTWHSRVNCYCPKHASLRLLQKESVRCEDRHCKPQYSVGDFHYMYDEGHWFVWEWNNVENKQVNSLGSEYTREDALLLISQKQLELHLLRMECGKYINDSATSDECKTEVGGIMINRKWRSY